jgi:hypothetical protein
MRLHLAAAALALVGWYLMVPPRVSETPLLFDRAAPLSRWQALGSYDTASDCSHGNDKLVAALLRTGDQQTGKKREQALQERASILTSQQCIATGDPRFKPK